MAAIALQQVTKVFADGTVAVDDLTLRVAQNEFMVLLGPTGCGKTTVLRLIAGLESPTAGEIYFDGHPVDRMRARDRNIAMVFQEFALYPHLTVAENIAYPLRVAQVDEAVVATRRNEVVEFLGIGPILHRHPDQLSGGQRQRVAMARAVVRRPSVFLFDEPMSNLDAHLRADLRLEVVALARRFGVTTLYVTHDRTEALTMSDRIAVLRHGRLEQVGAPGEVYADPATIFVAAFLGPGVTSLLHSAVYARPDGGVVVDLGAQVIGLPPTDPRAAALAAHHNARMTLGVRAEALTLVDADPDRGDVLRGVVRLVEDLGHEAIVRVDTGAAPAANATTRLELPEPERDLATLFADEPQTGGALRYALSRLRAPEPPPAPTARTEFGFYPRYDTDQAAEPRGDLVVRILRPARVPRPGETVALAVDFDLLYLFDRAGHRVRLG
ncbi:MAG: multiple sugar transport system ATP-binding protein [Micromonosporaceae bacterium]|nr:multiple sugar transport system ATP-binding protein [Micromonosporaceae bacterium]